MNIDKKSKILVTIFFVLMFISAVITYYRYMILKDYEVINNAPAEENIVDE
mgnify:FL=1